MQHVSSSIKWFWSAWLIVLVHACAGDVDRPTLASRAEDMQEKLDAVQAELETHDRGVQSSREPTEIVNVERLHMEAMVIALHGLQGMVDEERDHGRIMASLISEMNADCDAMRSALGTSHRAAAMECPAYTNGLER